LPVQSLEKRVGKVSLLCLVVLGCVCLLQCRKKRRALKHDVEVGYIGRKLFVWKLPQASGMAEQSPLLANHKAKNNELEQMRRFYRQREPRGVVARNLVPARGDGIVHDAGRSA
jgi:hypothetical protein